MSAVPPGSRPNRRDVFSDSDAAPAAEAVAVGRRGLLRGGAVLAGAAGAVALTAVAARPAYAADGEPLVLGRSNDATSSTIVEIGGATGDQTVAAVSLRNADGPSLELQPLAGDWNGELAVGQIANTEIGPSIGLVDPFGDTTVSYLATEFDLLAQPTAEALAPFRLVDTRFPDQRAGIIDTPAQDFDSAGRLRAGRTMTVALADAGEPTVLSAAFLNTAVTGSLGGGHVTVFPPGDRPSTSTLNFAQGQTIANGSFTGVSAVGDWYAVSVYANQTTHIIVDLTGVISALAPATNARRKAPGVRRPRASKRPLKLFGRR